MKTARKILLGTLLLLFLFLLPILCYGQEDTNVPPSTGLAGQMAAAGPPVEQPLVPEGAFAVQLVETLKIGQGQDEVQAESTLSALGIEPKNGWIAGYPVTPPIIGEIEKGVAAAADQGKLGMGKDQAMKAIGDLKAKLGLNVAFGGAAPPPPPTPASRGANTVIYKYIDRNRVTHYTDRMEGVPKEYRNQTETIGEGGQFQPSGGTEYEDTGTQFSNYTATPPPEVINNYYYASGPPVVTYYAPPDPYYYLYSWVPYPFWYSRFYFPGYFILHDFHRRVFFNNRPCYVSNHVFNPATRRVASVDPASRALRAGQAFNHPSSSQGFRSPAVQASARTIAGFAQSRPAAVNVTTVSRMSPMAPLATGMRASAQFRPSQGGGYGQSMAPRSGFSPPAVSMGRTFSSPSYSPRAYSPPAPRFSSAPSYSPGRTASAPSAGVHSGGIHGGGGGGSSRGGGGSRGGGRR